MRLLSLVSIVVLGAPAAVVAQTTAWGDPDLQGVWDYSTLAGLERPPYVDTAFLETPEDHATMRRHGRRITTGSGRSS